ncbi:MULTISPECIES: hypothetical protein [unclassified Streptomyces]|uniref:hypothetical protein n=1 Tax=unclassified Streptomyces TaxID=2593676 RepID=UPI0034354D3F
MSETPDEPGRSELPDTASVSRRRRVVALAVGVLLTGAVAAGTGVTAVTVANADRDPGAPSWQFPRTVPADGEPPAPQGLAALLLPYGEDGRMRGPDLGEFGADAQLSGARATAVQKEALQGLPRSQRERLEKEIDRRRITGMAMRSFVSGSGSLSQDDVYTASIVLSQMDNRSAVRGLARSQAEFLEALDVLRKGPRIEGHKDAACFLPPKDKERDIEVMFCTAHVGDVLVTVTASAAAPIDARSVAALVREQLDRIEEPGKAV